MPNADAVNILNDLIRTSEDRKRTFAEAAKTATTSELKALFQRRSIDCESAVIELQWLVTSLGGTPKRRGTIAGMARCVWARAATALRNANIAMLEEAERAEYQARAIYAKALTAGLPKHIRSAVQFQHHGAVRNYALIRDLRNCHQAAREYFGSGGLT